jgi:HK97 family phage major capsid protein
MSIEDSMTPEQITQRQREMCEAALAEKRGFTESEEAEYAGLEKVYVRKKTPSRNKPILPIPLTQWNEMENRRKNMGTPKELSPETRDFYSYLADEKRTLMVDLDTSGGFATVPEVISNQIIFDLDNEVAIRKFARKYLLNAQSQGIPVMAEDLSAAKFTGEVSEASLDTQMAFEKRALYPRRLVKAIKVSRTLLDIGVDNFAQFVIGRLTNMIAITEESSFMTGSGAGECLGIFTTSNGGVPSDRNVSSGNSATEIHSDGLINAMYNLKASYLRSASCRWVFHRDALKMIRKMKSGDGQYLWEPGIGTDRPSTILGIPYILSEYCPNSFVSGARVGCIADLSYYGIAEIGGFKMQVLREKYALENCDAFVCERFIDAAPLLKQAFSMVTLA